MPTITIETTVEDPRVHRRFAKNVSLWLRQRGIDINHVITKFVVTDPCRVFSGPFPLAGAGAEPGAFAFAHCTIDRARSSRFRWSLAQKIVGELQSEIPPDHIFVQFELVEPQLHLIGSEIVEEADS